MSPMAAAVSSFRKSESLLLEATRQANFGDILDAVLTVNQAEYTAKTGAAVAKAAIEISDSILDILA